MSNFNPKKDKVPLYFLFSLIISSLLLIFYLHIRFSFEINQSLVLYPEMMSIIIFIILRACIIVIMALYAFHKWLNMKTKPYSSLFYLFGLFFLGLVLGKFFYLLYLLTYFTGESKDTFIILKIRYIFIVITAAPLIYIGLNFILSLYSTSQENSSENYQLDLRSKIIFISFTLFPCILLVLAPNIIFLNTVLIFFHISSLIWISFTFYYAHKNKFTSQINPLIITLAFFIDLILYVLSTLSQQMRSSAIGFSATYIIFAELIDLIIIIAIFFGFYLKPNYNSY